MKKKAIYDVQIIIRQGQTSSLTPNLLLAAGAVDYGIFLYHEQRIQTAMDAAVIIGTNLTVEEQDAVKIVHDAFDANIGDDFRNELSGQLKVELDPNLTGQNSRAISATYNGVLLSVFGNFINQSWDVVIGAIFFQTTYQISKGIFIFADQNKINETILFQKLLLIHVSMKATKGYL